jgi:hypothetical protein
VRLGVASLGMLLVTGLGAATVDLLGWSDARSVASDGSRPKGIPQSPEEEPRPLRTPRPAGTTPQPQDLPVDPAPQGPPAAATAPASPPAPPNRPEPVNRPAPAADPPAPGRTVRTGAPCAAVGQTATTKRGDAAVCSPSRGNGPNKWRAA